METEAQRLNSLRLQVARVRDKRLERLMLRIRRQRERSQSRNRARLFAQARLIAKLHRLNAAA